MACQGQVCKKQATREIVEKQKREHEREMKRCDVIKCAAEAIVHCWHHTGKPHSEKGAAGATMQWRRPLAALARLSKRMDQQIHD